MTTTTPNATLTIRCQFCETWNRVDGTRSADRPKCGSCGRFLLIDRPWTLYEDTFARTISESELPVFVDFYADWCGPCKMMAPAVDELAARHTGRLLVAKLNTDHAPYTAQQFQIRGIPTSILFKNGAEVTRQSGLMPLAALEDLVRSVLP